MTRTDSFVVGTLVVLLAIIAGLVGVPALSPAATTPPTPGRARSSMPPGRIAKASSGTRSRSAR